MDYHIIYKLIYVSAILTYIYMLIINKNNVLISNGLSNLIIGCFILALIITFGTRGVDIGTDTKTYLMLYDDVVSDTPVPIDVGFYGLILLSSVLGKSYFLLICSIVYLIPIGFVFMKLRYKHKLLFFLLLITLFSFQSLGINILRQGIALSFVLLSAYYLLYKKKLKVATLVYIVACVFHFSVLLFFLCYFLAKYTRIRTQLLILCGVAIFSFLGDSIIIILVDGFMGGTIRDKLMSYATLGDSSEYSVGFRVDFLLYNMTYILIGIYCVKKFNFKNSRNLYLYKRCLGIFILLTAMFCISFNIPFSDRVGVLSWFFIPLICVPVAQINKHRILILSSLMFINVTLFFIL